MDPGRKLWFKVLTFVNKGFYQAMERHLAGTLAYGENDKLGLDGGYVSASLTDNTKKLLTAEQLEVVSQIEKDIIAGTIDPGTAFDKAEGWFADFAKQQDTANQ